MSTFTFSKQFKKSGSPALSVLAAVANKSGIRLLLSISLLTGVLQASAQLSGSYSITGSSTPYATIAAAVTALNTNGVSGPVTFNVAAGYTETAPVSPGYLLGSATLNASTSATNTITFQKSGSGADPLITAYTGVGATDGIFNILGTDYVTINGIDLQDAGSNTNDTTEMEYGYAFFFLNNSSPYDASQNDVIENCTITLSNSNASVSNVEAAAGASGIFAQPSVHNNDTALNASLPGDLFSNNKIYGNTIRNVTYGVYLAGSSAASLDQNNDIGGSSPGTGNTIQNLAVPPGSTAPLVGIFAVSQGGLNASYNTINNTAGGGLACTVLAIGIEVTGAGSTFTVNNNNISLTITEGVVTGSPYNDGIYAPTTGTLTADNNVITMVANKHTMNNSSLNTGIMNGILTYTLNDTLTNLTASDNTININQMDTAPVYGINAAVAEVPSGGAINITGNTITGKTNPISTAVIYSGINPDFDTSYPPIATCTLYGIYLPYGNGAINVTNNAINLTDSTQAAVYGVYSTSTGALDISDNNITVTTTIQYYTGGTTRTTLRGVTATTHTATTASETVGFIYLTGTGVSETVTGNTFFTDSLNIAAPDGGIFLIYDNNSSSGKTITYNATPAGIRKHRNGAGEAAPSLASLYGLYSSSQATSGSVTISYNNFSNVTADSGWGFCGIAALSVGAATASLLVSHNTIANCFSHQTSVTGGGPATGMILDGNVICDSNIISYISNYQGTSEVSGIEMVNSGAGTVTISNNDINNILNRDQPVGIGVNAGYEGVNIYGNKIYDVICGNPVSFNSAFGISIGDIGIPGVVDTVNIYNNTIDSIEAPAFTSDNPVFTIAGIYIAEVTPSTEIFYIRVYDNSIYLDGSAGPGYESAGIFYGQGETSGYNNTLLLQNNIIINNMRPNGASEAVDFVSSSSSVLPTYLAASNNNMFYAGTPGPNNLIYYDGTNTEETLADYKAYMSANGSGQDQASVTEAHTPFVSISGASANFLKLDTTATVCYNNGIDVPLDSRAPGNNIDYFGIIRAGYSGYLGGASKPTIGASEIVNIGPLQAQSTTTNASCGACTGTASVSASYGIAPYHYKWMPGNDTTATIQNLCAGTYIVTVTDALDSIITDTAVVGLSSSLSVNLGPDTSICTGGALTLNAGNAGASYIWSNQATTQTITVRAAGNYSVTVSVNGCSAADTISVGNYNLPPVNITPNTAGICPGDSTQICAPDSFTAYYWNTGDTGLCIYANTAGNYYVTVTYSNGCVASSNQAAISVFQPGATSITVNGDTFTTYGGIAYQWYFDSALLANDTTARLIADKTGSYTVQITDSNGCTKLSTPQYYTGILNITGETFEIYPNPASANLKLTGTDDLTGKTLEIYDACGKLVYSSRITNRITEIDVSMLASDVYILKIETGVRMFIKQ